MEKEVSMLLIVVLTIVMLALTLNSCIVSTETIKMCTQGTKKEVNK